MISKTQDFYTCIFILVFCIALFDRIYWLKLASISHLISVERFVFPVFVILQHSNMALIHIFLEH